MRSRIAAAAIAVTIAAGLGAGTAAAHIQVTPEVVAPGDAVRFTLLVPGERSEETTKVDLKVPAGVLPFSYGETPGWTRRVVPASNGAIDRIVWTGRIPSDGFVELSFLAGMPDRPATLSWKALQTYADGEVARWIGAPDSERPASITRVEVGAARQNAGGESGGGDVAPSSTATSTPVSTDEEPDGGGTDWIARGLGVAALVAAAAVALIARRRA